MKKIIVLILLFAMAVSLFACGDGGSGQVTEGETLHETEGEAPSEPDTYVDTEPQDESKNDESESETPTEGVESGSDKETNIETEPVTDENESEKDTSEKESEEMETVNKADRPASVGKYEKYDLDVYMSPIWDGKVIHNETVMFVGPDDKAPLLYDADKIISVRSYDLKTEYVKGVDYDYVDGKLVLLEGTRIPYVPLSTYYSVLDPEKPYLSTMYNGQVTQTMYGDNTTMTQWQVAVTYKHSDTWNGKVVESYEDRYADFIGKLERGEDVTVFFYGDSITTGATSSQSRAPYAPSFARMFVQYVAKQYGYTVKYVESYSDADLTNGKPAGGTTYPDTVFGTNGTITYINNAVGGWSAQNGLDNYASYVGKYIREYGCDLFVLAFGMNIPGSGCTASEFTGLLEQIVRNVHRGAPDADVVLVSTMIPNPEAVPNKADTFFCNRNQYTFEEGMYPLTEEINKNGISCAVAPMTSVSQYIHAQKRYRDTTGNNVNHPSDFLARTYAQVIYQTVFGYENYEKAPVAIGETPTLDVNYNAIIGGDAAGEIFLDGKMGTANKNDAMCVRIEKTEGGYFMYYVAKGTKIYVNAAANELAYAMSGETVWTYNATLKAMVCDGSELAIKLVTPEICFHPIIVEGEQAYRESCLRCGVEHESLEHSFAEKVTTESDGTKVYALTCTICGYVKSSYSVPGCVNHYYTIANMGIYNGTDDGLMTEDGMNFRRIRFTNGDGHVFVNGDNITAKIDGDTGNYLVIKYRTSKDKTMRFDLCTSDNEGSRTTVSKIAAMLPDGWEIAVIDLAQFAKYTRDSELGVQVRITTGLAYIDIAYVAIVDSTSEAEQLIGEGKYVLYTNWASSGEDREVQENIPENPVDPEDPEDPVTDGNKHASVGIYEKYDIDTYMSPVWDGKVVHNETVMFVGKYDKAPLLYSADKIISVRSYDLSIEYVQGVDYDYVDGYLVLLEGTRIPYVPLETYYSVLGDKPYLSTMYNGVVTQTMYGEGDTMCRWQVAVTYKHTDTWEGPALESYTDRFAGFIEKLENGEDVTIFFYGDSITAGANASSSIGKAPFAPIWPRMFTQYVAKQYGYTVKSIANPSGGGKYSDTVYGMRGTITFINNAVGGWNTQQGRDNFDTYVKAYIEEHGCDLFVLAFGMNNGGSTADAVCGYLEEIIVKIEDCAPDTDLLLVSTMIPNPEAVRNPADAYFCNGTQPTFEAAMIPLAEKINARGTDCALAPMTSVSKYLHSVKRFRDTTGNNVNHPSDFLVRIYAQVLFETVFGFENHEKELPNIGEAPVVNVNYNGKVILSDGGTLFLDGASGTTNANDAVCVRLEACEGGYHLYYVNAGKKVYINDAECNVFYSEEAYTVWEYDPDANYMVCAGGLEIELTAPEICLHPNVIAESGHGKEACLRCGIEASVVDHNMTQSTVTNSNGSVTYSSSCTDCGYVGSSYTVPAGVVYYSGVATSKSPDFYRLNGELKSEGELNFTRVTAQTSDHGHELHWIRQNTDPHTDYAGNLLDTKGNRYLVIKIRASHETINMTFSYMLYGAASQARCAVPVVKAGEWMTYVLDLKSIHPDYYVALEDGSFTMQRFKMGIGAGFDQIENGYIDFGYMALCASFDDIEKIVDAETVRFINVNGAAPIEIKPDGNGIGDHSLVEDPRG